MGNQQKQLACTVHVLLMWHRKYRRTYIKYYIIITSKSQLQTYVKYKWMEAMTQDRQYSTGSWGKKRGRDNWDTRKESWETRF